MTELIPQHLTAGEPDTAFLEEAIALTEKGGLLSGLYGSAKSYVVHRVGRRSGLPLLLVVKNNQIAEMYLDDLEFFSDREILLFPDLETLPFDDTTPQMDLICQRITALHALQSGAMKKGAILIAPVRALLGRTTALEHLTDLTRPIHVADKLDPEQLTARLVQSGYRRVEMVESVGQFARRGGILDLGTPNESDPIRIEFWENEVASIRRFDLATQRSTSRIETVTVLPLNEIVLLEEAAGQSKKLHSLLDYLPTELLTVIDEPEQMSSELRRYLHLAGQLYRQKRGGEFAVEDYFLTWEQWLAQLKGRRYLYLGFLPSAGKRGMHFRARSAEHLGASPDETLRILSRWVEEGLHLNIVCDNDGQLHRLTEIIREGGYFGSWIGKKDYPHLHVGALHTGFILEQQGRIAYVTDRDIFRRYKRIRHRKRFLHGTPLATFTELAPGDYVVHINHGIGRFLGIRRVIVEHQSGDFITIEYSGGDLLYVPVYQIDLVQRYIGADDAEPAVSTLGKKTWQKKKERVTKAVEAMTKDLLELYAAREVKKGHRFAEDGVWQNEFESSFLFQETPDQLKATEEIKRDMESVRPMDRLLCGDVGYGKTEVAVRAIFKAITEKKQAAILVPTTILAMQHYNTIRERLAGYPLRVELLSRFRSPAEQRRVLEGLRDGVIDVVVGTHRLIQKDVKFFDLGLVIIDEEHRFGVSHKEQLKKLRTEVDVITLSATPIPRTLYMSLSGIRDMSTINTPPADRLPIKTYLHRYDPDVIRAAILREVNRGGQIYYVHNRVMTIEDEAAKLKEMVPEARVAIGHGQMPSDDLERVMIDFVDKKYDVLVCTTIIESGLDIPNVNTIIINRADRFGLAQLYQLRGRVGRDRYQAFAYLLIPPGPVSAVAMKRLQALQDYEELGSGFKIAMRDLELRGAGNLLGGEQHGLINAVGFELYCRMVKETVARLRGELLDQVETVLEVSADAAIPETYVHSGGVRIGLYKRLANAGRQADLDDLRLELIDRFGNPPSAVETLFDIAGLKLNAGLLGITLADLKKGQLVFERGWEHQQRRVTDELRQRGLVVIEEGRNLYIRNVPGIDLRKMRELLHRVAEKAKRKRRAG